LFQHAHPKIPFRRLPLRRESSPTISVCCCFGLAFCQFPFCGKACESLFAECGFRILGSGPTPTDRPTTGPNYHQMNLSLAKLFYATFPSGFSCLAYRVQGFCPVLSVRATREDCTISWEPFTHPSVSQVGVVAWHIVNQRRLSTITRVPRVRMVSCLNLHIFLINRMKFSYNFVVEPIWLIKFVALNN